MKPKGPVAACPCGSDLAYAACCGALHAGAAAASPVHLMRARYAAYVLGREDYLLATWHPSTRPQSLNLSAEPQTKWLGLEVCAHQQIDPDQGTVAFVARYRSAGRGHRLQELSRFRRQDGHWYYVDGDVTERQPGPLRT